MTAIAIITPSSPPWNDMPPCPMSKPRRYMRPYQRTASGPMEKAMGSMLGWWSMALAGVLPRGGEKIASAGAEAASTPREPHVEPRMRVGYLSVGYAAPAEVGYGGRHDRHAQSARHQAHHCL